MAVACQFKGGSSSAELFMVVLSQAPRSVRPDSCSDVCNGLSVMFSDDVELLSAGSQMFTPMTERW